jgi:hypothetical protein
MPLRCSIVATALALLAGAPATAAVDADATLLAASDPFARAPAELRAEVRVTSGPGTTALPIEIWRRGENLALIRFLAPKERGKFLLRRERAFYLLAPGARSPVALAPALARAGAGALDELFAVRLVRDYTIVAAATTGDLVTFDLAAKPGGSGAASPRLRWVVDRARRLPVRGELRSAAGRVGRLVEFKEWRDVARLEPRRLVIKDVVRGGAPLEVEFVGIEARAVPESLFDLTNGSARAALPLPAPPLSP